MSDGPAHIPDGDGCPLPPAEGPPRSPGSPSSPAPAAAAQRGRVLVNTGNGKGKTTAALGVALRALGWGQRVLIIQFIKGTWHYGELEAVKRLPEITLVRAGAGFYKILDDSLPEEIHRQAAAQGLELARRELARGDYPLIVLDEVNVAVSLGLLTAAEVAAAVKGRSPTVNVILTGRGAPGELLDLADTVTEMREIRHAFQQGRLAEQGIDF